MKTWLISRRVAALVAASSLAIANSSALAQAPDSADYGDAPDGASACEAGGIVTPALYPTIFDTLIAVPGRTAPYHVPLDDPNADYFFSAAPTYEAAAFQPTCDWITPPCDYDGGPAILCLNGACTTGVVVLPGAPCLAAAARRGYRDPSNCGPAARALTCAVRRAPSARRDSPNPLSPGGIHETQHTHCLARRDRGPRRL
jgi:hypothetical protein